LPLIEHTALPSFARLRAEGQEVLSPEKAAHQDIRELHIGLLNMMPDAALAATERQFLRLLGSCNRIVQVYVHPFTLPGIHRQGDAAQHVSDHYQPFEAICEQGLDALIISGANPVEPDIRDEPYWSELEAVMEWAHDNVTSTVCSCLATHARIAQYYGVNRVPLADKQWGVFSHRVLDQTHPLTVSLNTRFDAPHSRWNNARRDELEAAGIIVLAESEEAGVQLAVSPDGIRWVFLQGHPEYDVTSLPKEYKREVMRFATGVHQHYPPFPDHCFNAEAKQLLERHREDMEKSVAQGTPAPDFPDERLAAHLENSWTDTAKALFNNWLGLVYQLASPNRCQQFMSDINPHDPLGLKSRS
jgi:homoserine O-succinyltransferase